MLVKLIVKNIVYVFMNFFWVYDLPNWLFAVLTITVFLIFGLFGMLATRKVARKMHIEDHSHNDIVSYFLAAVTVFYGITLGLVAIGTWNSFSEVNNKVDTEAQIITSLFRDLDSLPEPYKAELRNDLIDYTHNVITVSWPLQRQGIPPVQSAKFLRKFQGHLEGFEPAKIRDQITVTEIFKQFNSLIEVRRSRVNATFTRLPASLWSLVIIGGLICLSVTFFFDVKSKKMHIVMTCFFAGLLGLMIFLIGTLDNPFRGKVSVSPRPLELIYKQMVTEKNQISTYTSSIKSK
ncbi:bestrophin-like domain [Mucilaginibacter ginkgonis]|uniref:DUF4239 domain-containing protein n=1 Tax=Mucilaginibacter ginkgonis TaxID=2682091 RepID=A0A6I4HUA5_9SPHI|nr:DUF4239 domain-containing protein [Mucilaginibacter ginkgonis]QQL50222.1 DUF4239 domain-containing protein [Mucilaginibacter ginkgonis]